MPKIDKERFQRVLERAIEIDADDDDRLSERELFAAARELGVNEGSVRAALAEEAAQNGEVPRPFDTPVSLQTEDDTLTLHVPALGMTRELFAVSVLSSLSVGFAICWTLGAAMGAGWPATFGLPFLIVGLAICGRWMRAAWQVDELQLGPDSAELVSQVGPFVWKRALRPELLRTAWQPERTKGTGRSRQTEPAHLVIEHGNETIRLMGDRSEQELRWVNEALGRWLIGRGAKSHD